MNAKQDLEPIIQGFVPGLPEIGKIKIGIKGKFVKTKTGKEFQPPQKLDHFLITKFDRDSEGNFITDDELMDVIKQRDKSKNSKGDIVNIPIMLIYNDVVQNFQSRFTCYDGRTLWCYGDGTKAYRLDKDKKQQEVSCPCERCTPEYEGKPICKPYGVLSVIIRKANTIGGVWKFRTTSYFNCRNIPSSMLFIKALTGGQLAKIPLDLIIEPQMVTLRDGKQTKIYLVKIVYTEGDIDQLAETGYRMALNDQYQSKRMEQVEQEARKLITAEIESIDDDVLDELRPDTVEAREEEPVVVEELKPTPKLPSPRKAAVKEPEPEVIEVEIETEELEQSEMFHEPADEDVTPW